MSPPGEQCRALVVQFCKDHLADEPKRAQAATQAVSQPETKKPREQIAAFLDEGHRGGALAAARAYWQAEPSASVARYITSLADKMWPAGRTSVHRVAFLRSFTVEPMVPMLQAEAALDGCRIEAWVGDFNAYGQDILNPASGLYASKPDTVVFAVLLRDISPALGDGFADLAEGDVEAEIGRAAENVIDLLTALRQRTNAHILVQGFERPLAPALGILDGRRKLGQGDAILALNARIRAYAAAERAVTWLDYEDVQSRFGRKAWADDRKWLMARLPVSVDAMPHLAAAWWQHIAPAARPQAKVLVLDLDNTLWGGTVGEDGYAGLKIGSDHPGAFFRNLQRVALDLARRGVLIAIASKNNEADAMEVITKHPGMLIRPEHLAAHRINWKPKPENIIDMAKELSLGLDSFVFVDDNPAEREAVRRLCPDVTVVELPKDPALYAECLRRVASFERHGILAEDKDRGRYYREERERRDLMSGAGTLDDYLAALKVTVEIARMSGATLARAAQLTQKTNQLNMTTRRYTETEMDALAKERGVEVYVLTASDRFGDNGLVGVAITKTKGKTCDIDTFLLSCRVIGRGVETAFLSYISEGARARGMTKLTGWFLPTAKNAPAAEIYKIAGFAAGEKNAKGEQMWTLNLKAGTVAVPAWIALNPAPLSSVA
jgi:FkbH-like protein